MSSPASAARVAQRVGLELRPILRRAPSQRRRTCCHARGQWLSASTRAAIRRPLRARLQRNLTRPRFRPVAPGSPAPVVAVQPKGDTHYRVVSGEVATVVGDEGDAGASVRGELRAERPAADRPGSRSPARGTPARRLWPGASGEVTPLVVFARA